MFFLIKLYLSAILLQVPVQRQKRRKKKPNKPLEVINKNNNNFALFYSEVFPQPPNAMSAPAPAETSVQF